MLANNKEIIESVLTSSNLQNSIKENLDTLLSIIPEIKDMIGFEHKHPHHHLDVWNHTLLALSKSPNDLEIRLSLLLHDIGKPHSYTEGEVRHFHNHANVSSDIARTILTRLNYTISEINTICELIRLHDTPMTETEISENREFCTKLFQIQYCDALSHHPNKLDKRLKYLKETEEKLMSRTLKKGDNYVRRNK